MSQLRGGSMSQLGGGASMGQLGEGGLLLSPPSLPLPYLKVPPNTRHQCPPNHKPLYPPTLGISAPQTINPCTPQH